MSLVTLKELLKQADAGGYAVGAFNCNNMEIIQAIMQAAEAERSPVILQASQGALGYAGIDYIVAMARVAAAQSGVPVALHLDHGTDYDQLLLCIGHGFSSVMIDGSKHSLEENIALTRKVVEIARAVGVSVEGELGRIGGTEEQVKVSEGEVFFTDPEEARTFVRETGVDAFAPSVGTAHGQYHGRPELDFPRLAKIRKLTGIPLVLHGSSGVPDEDIVKAISLGVRKVNIDTDIRRAFVNGIKQAILKHPQMIDPRELLGPGRKAARDVVVEKIRLFGSAGQA